MKTKRKWHQVPWTPFEQVPTPDSPISQVDPVDVTLVNSRYQVSVWNRHEPFFGPMAHLSIKTHDRAAYHDWRDLQRIKNEICGPDYDAVEIYPSESKLVDTANQYHLFVFAAFKLPFGFQTRLVGDGTWQKSRQRPWPKGERPADCVTPDAYDAMWRKLLEAPPPAPTPEVRFESDLLTAIAEVTQKLLDGELPDYDRPEAVDLLRDVRNLAAAKLAKRV